MPDSEFTSKALVQAPAEIAAPSAGINTYNTGTAFAALSGPYAYKLTSMNGGESTASSEFYHTAIGSGVAVYFTEIAGATDYRLYRAVSGQSDFVFVANASGSPIVDIGTYSGHAPPTGNTTATKSRGMGTSPTVFYEVTGDYRVLVKEILVSSTNEDDVTYNLYFVPNGESPAYGNAIFNTSTLQQNEFHILSLNTVLEQGDSIQARASDMGSVRGYGVVTLKISGIVIT